MSIQDIIRLIDLKNNQNDDLSASYFLDNHRVKDGYSGEVIRLNNESTFLRNIKHSLIFHPDKRHILNKYRNQLRNILGVNVFANT